MVETLTLTFDEIEKLKTQVKSRLSFAVLKDNYGILKVGYGWLGRTYERIAEYKDHYGQVWHEYPVFSSWFRITFYCEKCKTKHTIERWLNEAGELVIRFWE